MALVLLTNVRSICAQAFQRWAQVTSFTFEKVPATTAADITIGFHRGNHGDGSAFDGPRGTFAHANPPRGGNFHYDADERWSSNPGPNEVDLESVAVHEIGHLLGLNHNPDLPASIMYPYFDYGIIKRDLHRD
ncbi:PREDICTED: metalloendoproteinase 3-MMP-like [Prunus mume]|uniref:Metalloendoproteinase 3-MMP-like n=1 Tax=Prunus mume TaxID=102107 RepID=A0ABM0P2F5_PRUMU|nr:PREDICTED: metalloendoproteinase 3-MMP-like [Prunus mume]